MQPRTFEEFWPYYLTQHAQPVTRGLHLIGTTAATLLLTLALMKLEGRYALAAPVVAYGLAWLGHGVIEHNHPATFRHPLWSLRADYKMCWLFITGRLDAELKKAGVEV